MRRKTKTVMDQMNAEKPDDMLADLEAKHGSSASAGYAFLWAGGGWDKKNWKQFETIKIPWAMVAPHDAQAKANHCGQDLAKLQSRGGVSYCEALAILDDSAWRAMDETEAHDELKRRVDACTHNDQAQRSGWAKT